MLGTSYLTLHNINHYLKLMENLREAIRNNNYDETAEMLLNQYKVGDIETEEGIQATYLGTEYADDSKVKYYLESFAHNLKLIRGGKFFNNV